MAKSDGKVVIEVTLSTEDIERAYKQIGKSGEKAGKQAGEGIHDNISKGVDGATAKLGGLKAALGKIGSLISVAFIGRELVNFGKKSIDLGSNVSEVQNVVTTAFGDMEYKIEKFSKTSIQQFGMSKLAAKKTASTYMAMARGMQMPADAASDMAIALTGLSGDVASFFNKSQEEADVKLRSIFTGETEALKDLGVVMTQTNLKAFAARQGINKNIEAMSQAELVTLRYKFVTEQLALANGDFAKTQNSWANQTRILSMQWQEFMSVIGQGLIQVLTPALRALNQMVGVMISWAQTFANVTAAIFGKQETQAKASSAAIGGIADASLSAASGQDKLASSTKKAAKEAKSALAPYDELHIIQNDSSGGDSAGMGGSSASMYSNDLASPLSNADNVIDPEIAERARELTKAFNQIREAFVKWKPAIIGVGVFVTGFISLFKIGKWISNLKALGAAFSISAKFTAFVEGIKASFVAIGALVGVSAGAAAAIIAGIAAAIAGIVLLIVYWDEVKEAAGKAWDWIKEKWNAAGEWIKTNVTEPIKRVFSEMWENIKTVFSPITEWFKTLFNSVKQTVSDVFYNIGVIASGCWEIVKAVWGDVSNWFRTTVIDPISGFFSNMWDSLKIKASEAWEGIKNAFSPVVDWFRNQFTAAWTAVKNVFSTGGKIFDGITQGITAAFKTVVNAIINGINKVVAIPFNSINRSLDKLRNTQIMGLAPFVGLKTISIPQIPKLARGAVIPPNREFMAVLGDQKNGRNLEAPEDLIRKIVREESGGRGDPGGDWHIYIMMPDGTIKAETIITAAQRANQRAGKTVIAVEE